MYQISFKSLTASFQVNPDLLNLPQFSPPVVSKENLYECDTVFMDWMPFLFYD